MKESNNIETLTNVSPTEYAYQLAIDYTFNKNSEHKKEYGQYFTPVEVAEFMAKLSNIGEEKIRILDPGCGTGILFCALIEHLT